MFRAEVGLYKQSVAGIKNYSPWRRKGRKGREKR